MKCVDIPMYKVSLSVCLSACITLTVSLQINKVYRSPK